MRILIIIISLHFLLLSGCSSDKIQSDPEISPDNRATSFLQKGEYELAGDEFLKLSELYPDRSAIYKIDAASAFIKGMNLDKALAILENKIISESGQDILFYQNVLLAKMALFQNQPEYALQLSNGSIPEPVDSDYVIDMHMTRANAFVSLNSLIKAAQELIKHDALLISKNISPLHTNRIWNYLINSEIDELKRSTNLNDHNLITWLELAIISKTLMTRTNDLKQAITSWRGSNPKHPANEDITSQLFLISEQFESRPAQIALLLPLSGVYERYAERIRDGFLSAWFLENNYKPRIRIYNTDIENFTEIYSQAVSEGAEFIVGPLDKESVRILADMENVPVRTLALNQVGIDRNNDIEKSLFPIPDVVQFGLPPEDEAKQVAQRGIIEGYNRVLIITSADEYGNRVFNAFREEWSAMGGTILERVDYDPQTSDFVTPIKQLLNINSSEARYTKLRQKLGRSISGSSRLREDVEFIFMVANNLNARQIVPHLRFFRAEGVPIYTISSVYTGKQNPQIDNDLNGVEFVEIPWLLESENNNINIANEIHQSWPSASSIFPRYYAFGIDAFRLISQIGDLSLKQNHRYQGETGYLSLNQNGEIHRELLWARFENGIPSLLNTEMAP
jgi:uncharacterized protein